jgi:endonuclease YncB( thermonuclease family)
MREYARLLSASAAVVMLAASSHASAQVLTGSATVADGDSLVVGSQRVRLFGIDAPEPFSKASGPPHGYL